MISKFAVWGRTRVEAIERMRRALREYEIGGIKTTLPFFREVLEDKVFVAGDLDTGFISAFESRRSQTGDDEDIKAIALIAASLDHMQLAARSTNNAAKPVSKWARAARQANLSNRS